VVTKPDFLLSKWYLDCVADNGDTFIGYSAALHWKTMALHYTNITTKVGNSKTQTKTSLTEKSFPNINKLTIDWSSKALNLMGTWTILSEPIQRKLYDSPEGGIEWSRLYPRAKADVFFGKKQHIVGLGYAEQIELTIKPWQLPITELRWGRFLSKLDTVVWIDWRGTMPLSLVFYNGRQVNNSVISDDQIIINGGDVILTLTEKTELRQGSLVSTVLSMIPGVTAIFPAKILQAHECKWRSRGSLKKDGSLCSTGWAIHEVVRFP
jgi:hypothetical protein